MIMAELNKSNKQKIDVNTYRFESGRTIDEILKSDSRFWATDEQCLLNMIDSDWRYVEDFITEKEKELAKKFQAAANNPETDLKLLAVQSDAATQFLCQKHTNQELWEKAINDPNGRTRPYSKEVVNVENQINFPYELPSWIKNSIEEIPSNWFKRTPQQLQEEEEKEEIITAQAAVAAGLSYEEWEEMLNDNEIAEERIEQIQVNGGMNEAAIQADISASENKKADWIDSDGNPHWNDEEEIDEPVDMAGYEFDEYIHSDEFIEKFGDWEKINRLEKLENQQIIQVNSTIIDNGKDITEEIRNLRNNPTKENVKKLRDIGQSIGAKFLNTPFENLDTNESMIFVNNAKIQETTSHHIKDAGVIESIYHLPELIKNGILIQETLNEDKEKHPEIEKYQYLINGFKVEDEEYTAKTVISIDKQGRKFYDQRLSSIEKGNLIDLLKKESDSKNFSRLTKSGEFETALYNYDTRLFRVCQIPQFNFLERNEVTGKWQPTMEAVNKIKTDTLVLTKDFEGIELLADTETNITYGTNLSGFIKAIKESREKSKNIAYKNSNKSLEDELDNLKQTLQEKDKELDIWTAKAEADNKEISRLNNQLEAANNTIQKLEKQNKEQDELLNGKGSVKVNGVERKFEHGLKQAFPEAVKRIDIENQRNKELTADYNKLLKSHNQNISPKSPGDDSSWSN